MNDETIQHYLNRELSWLAFNKRVLEEAQNRRHPLFERLRFLSITARNMDEFFMVRVAGLKGQINAGVMKQSIDGLSPMQQLMAVRDQSQKLKTSMQRTWRTLRQAMAGENIEIVDSGDLEAADKKYLTQLFENDIFPVLTPMAVDPAHPFPFIPNQGLAMAFKIQDDKGGQGDYEALIVLSSKLKRFIEIPGEKARYILLEDLIMMNIDKVFPSPMKVLEMVLFRILRDSEIEIEDEAEDLVRTFETALKRRRRGNVIQLMLYENCPQDLLNFLMTHFNVTAQDVYKVDGLVGLADTDALIKNDRPELLFKSFDIRFPERIREYNGDCFAAIQHKDIVVHHPYESFDVVVQFLRQAAQDPDVVAIKQTLYRTSHDSPIVKALIEAAEAGKSVTALVELKARFDEEANIRWARDMERAGVQVVYGFVDLKTHAKVSLVLRREEGTLKTYAHFGTGNYHPQTAKVYTDLSYFTSDKDLCQDAALLFNYMTGYVDPVGMKSLVAAPLHLRKELINLIDNEIKCAQEGKPATIWIKCNAVLDEEIIDKLYEASQAGVAVDLIVRGICTLRPGVKGMSENIRVKSIIGRFLEHSRIYCFGNGHKLPSREAKVYIASADLMKRNLDGRIETMVPITNKTVHEQILDQIMVALLKDRKQSWTMNEDGTYIRIADAEHGFGAHDYFMNNPSLSGRGKSLEEAPMPPRLSLRRKKKTKT